MIIKSYINQINFLFTYLIKYYKDNVKSSPPLKITDFDNIEKIIKSKLSPELLTFLHWTCGSPIWKAPFIPFDNEGENFEVWSETTGIILIHLKYSEFYNRFQFMGGNYVKNSTAYKFEVCVDYTGKETGIKNSIFVKYGKKHQTQPSTFEDPANLDFIILANTITEFAEKYLKYLKTIPITIKKSKKVETLLNDPKKLFKFVKNYNFDEGEDKIEQIINDKRCDLATALLIYWLSQPYLIDEKTGTELNMIPMVIEKNVKDNFYAKSPNTFDPANNDITNFIDEYNRDNNIVRKIPDFMLNQKAYE